ncbi:MAG: hypothetical protein SNF68_04470 [Rikenellaceae bacterium]
MEKQTMNTTTANILYDAVERYTSLDFDALESLEATSTTTATFTSFGEKYAVTLCDVGTLLTLNAKITPTLCLYYSALDFAFAEGATPLICAMGTNGVGVISAVAPMHDEFYSCPADNHKHILVSEDGGLRVLANLKHRRAKR